MRKRKISIIPYTEGHRIFRTSFRKVIERGIIPHVEEWEAAGIMLRNIWKKWGKKEGFLCTGVPDLYGGTGADF